MRTRVSKAFTLVEILIVVVILGILAAIVIPQFTNASQDAQVGNVETQLQTIRSQIELYRVHNNGTVPDFAANQWADLVGPDYMRTAPINPRNGSSVVTVGANPGTAAASGATATGWYYDPAAPVGTDPFTAAGFNEDFRTDGSNQPWYASSSTP